MYVSLWVSAGFLSSCGSTQTQELVSQSSDKSGQIKVSGARSSSFDPFKTNIIIIGYNQSDTLMTEIYAKDLTNENVTFNWSDNSSCVLTFTQQDNSQRIMDVKFAETGNSLRELNKQ